MEELWSGHGWKAVLDSAKLPDGREKKAVRMQRADSVHLLAFPAPNTILLLREFRPFYGQYIWMLPSGRVDKENDIEAAAQRELQEETGFKAASLEHYFTTQTSESLIMKNHVFIARALQKAPLSQDDDELIEVHEMSVQEALAKVQSSPVVHNVSGYALLRYLHEHP